MKVLTIDGHLGKDATIMQTPKGTEFVSITLANTTYIKGEDKTVWYDVTFLNVDSLRSRLQYLKKGTYVAVSGLPDDSGYVGKDGKIYVNHYLLGDRIEFLKSGKKDSDGQQTANGYAQVQQPVVEQNTGNYVPPMTAPNPAPAQPQAGVYQQPQYQQQYQQPEPQIPQQFAQPAPSTPPVDMGDDLPF